MLTKIIGAALGGKLAKQSKTFGGTTGAMIGAAAPFVLSRMSIPAMIAIGVGGYAAKKYFGKSKTDSASTDASEDPAPITAKTVKVVPAKRASKKTAPAQKASPVASIPQPATA